MEQPHVAISPKRREFFVPVLRTLSSLGAVTGLGLFWVAALKRDPRAPLSHVKLFVYDNESYFWDKTRVLPSISANDFFTREGFNLLSDFITG